MRRPATPRQTILLAAAILTTAAAGSGGQAADSEAFLHDGLPEAAREAWDATVLLETRSWTGNSRIPRVATGSGLILELEDDGRTIWIATSSHVVPCPGRCLVRVYLPDEGSARGRLLAAGEPAWRDSRRDLALVRATASKKAAVQVARTAETSLAAGSSVLAVGFPDLAVLTAHSGKASRRAKRYSTGHLQGSPETFRADYVPYGSTEAQGRLELARALTHSAPLLPGSSGGPLIDSAGRVLGINTGSLTPRGDGSCAERREACRVHLAVPVGELLEKVSELKSAW